jgi:hypothetical protein
MKTVRCSNHPMWFRYTVAAGLFGLALYWHRRVS